MRTLTAARIASAIVAGTLALSVFGLAGCSNSDDERRIAELEQQVQQLQSAQGESSASGTDGAQSGSGAAASDSQASTPQALAGEITDATTLDFSNRADALIAEADAQQAPADRSQAISIYFDYDARFESLEDEIDRYEDQKEAEYQQGTLAWEDFRVIDAQLDAIDARLDQSKSNMEWRFGVDD